MAKDPAFLFYPGDWLGGTMTFTRAHKGAYMDLLMAQFNNGHMCINDIETILGPDFESMWEQKLKTKFLVDENGCYYNEKLEKEQIKRRNFTNSRRKNLSNEKHTNEHTVSHMETHMENGNENINKYKEDSIEYELSLYLLNRIKERNPEHKDPNLQSWSKHIDYMIRIDKRNSDKIKDVIKWCQNDLFWQNNILSTSKLRDQYDQLLLKMNGKKKEDENFGTCPKCRRPNIELLENGKCIDCNR